MFWNKKGAFSFKIPHIMAVFWGGAGLTHLTSVHRICGPSGHGRFKVLLHGGPVSLLAGIGGPESTDAAPALLISCIDFEWPILA